MKLEFFVPGVPQQQGSKTPWGAEANANLAPWRGAVAAKGHEVMVEDGRTGPTDSPCRLDVTFIYPRPKSHFRASGELKGNAPVYKVSTPDRDKLLRAIGDALTGVVWKDDSRIVSGWTEKRYGDFAGAEITVYELSDVPVECVCSS